MRLRPRRDVALPPKDPPLAHTLPTPTPDTHRGCRVRFLSRSPRERFTASEPSSATLRPRRTRRSRATNTAMCRPKSYRRSVPPPTRLSVAFASERSRCPLFARKKELAARGHRVVHAWPGVEPPPRWSCRIDPSHAAGLKLLDMRTPLRPTLLTRHTSTTRARARVPVFASQLPRASRASRSSPLPYLENPTRPLTLSADDATHVVIPAARTRGGGG